MEVSVIKLVEIASSDFQQSNIHNILLQSYNIGVNLSIQNQVVTSRRIIDK